MHPRVPDAQIVWRSTEPRWPLLEFPNRGKYRLGKVASVKGKANDVKVCEGYAVQPGVLSLARLSRENSFHALSQICSEMRSTDRLQKLLW